MTKKRGNATRHRRRVPRIPSQTLLNGVLTAKVDRLVRILDERAEFIETTRRDLDTLRRDADLQFKRIAQIQAQLDLIKSRVS